MNKITAAFKHKAFIPFITAGDPDLETTKTIIREIVANGADIVEIGIPFDPQIAETQDDARGSRRNHPGRGLTGGVFDDEHLGAGLSGGGNPTGGNRLAVMGQRNRLWDHRQHPRASVVQRADRGRADGGQRHRGMRTRAAPGAADGQRVFKPLRPPGPVADDLSADAGGRAAAQNGKDRKSVV